MQPQNTQSLPVLEYRQTILDAVADNSVTVITAETGAGKSTQVPRFLAEAGYRVVVTQPRRLAARTLAQRVAEEMNTRLGERVGYRTAEERSDSAATEVLFVTDGLQLVRELAGVGGTGRKTVLVLDEVHEWNLNMETLVAWVRQRIEAGDDLRVVLMSATLDAEKLSSFFGAAPVISVPGRLYPVERSHVADARKLVETALNLAKAGRNVLVFQPGKKEITEAVFQLQAALGASAVVLPLHGGLDPAEQQRCFEPAGGGKVKVVVATNVAQTSVTIPDIDAVVDSGVERRIELRGGIEGLYLLPTSQADCLQRAGRAGRTKPGVYVLCSETSMAERPEFPRAEVLRSRLDQLVLRLAVQGFDATSLNFFHQPNSTVLADGKRTLVALGAMSAEGSVTKIGGRMARFPVSVGFARMLIEAERFGVVEQVATIAACLESGDIRARDGKWASLTQQRHSDLLAVLDVFEAAKQVRGGGKANALREMGVFAKDFFRADETRRKLLKATERYARTESKSFGSKDEEREAILRACVAGMVDHLYRKTYGGYQNGSGGARQLARESVVIGSPDWVVGLPFDISGKGKRGSIYTLNLVGMATAVDPTWLVEVAPHLSEVKTGLRPAYDPSKDVLTSVTETYFNGQKVAEETVADGEHPEATNFFARWLSGQKALPDVPAYSAGQTLESVLRSNAVRQEQARQLNIRTGESTFQVFTSDEMFERFVVALSGVRRILEVVRPEALALPTLDEDKVASVLRDNPDTIEVLGEQIAVEYRAPYYGTVYAPRVTLTAEMVTVNNWNRLPEEGVRLPGGRSVEVVVSFGYNTNISNTNIAQLKTQVSNHLNKQQWENWTDRPEIALPDTSVDMVSIPDIVEATYGTSMIDESTLIAYGVAAVNSRYYSSDLYFKGQWFQSLEEAEAAHAAAITKLEEIRNELKEKREIAAAQAEAEVVRQELKALNDRNLPYELYTPVNNRRYSSLPGTVEQIHVWITETKALIAEVEETLAEAERQEEAERQAQAALELQQREELAEILSHSRVNGNLERALRVDSFVKEAIQIRGLREAVRILRQEARAEYGRARREDALEVHFPGINLVSGLDWAQGRDIEPVFYWANLKFQKNESVPKPQPVVTAPVNSPKADLSKVNLGGLFGGAAKKR